MISWPKARLLTFFNTHLIKFLSQQLTHDRSYLYAIFIFTDPFIAHYERDLEEKDVDEMNSNPAYKKEDVKVEKNPHRGIITDDI